MPAMEDILKQQQDDVACRHYRGDFVFFKGNQKNQESVYIYVDGGGEGVWFLEGGHFFESGI